MTQHMLRDESFFDAIHSRRLLDAFPDFASRSTASGGMALEPHVSQTEILAAFEGYEIASSSFSRRSQEFVLRRDVHIVDFHLPRGRASFKVYSKADNAREIVAGIEKRLEPFKRKNNDEGGIWVDFSYLGQMGVERSTQFLRAPEWESIRANYPAAARAKMEELFQVTDPWKHGRLIIWHGPPGTGKTWAIRSLMMHWRARFDYLVINDPERLAKEPAYYYEVASESHEAPHHHHPARPGSLADEAEDVEEPGRKRRCLFILEDCADLILKESRTHHFDKIGKLLNMTDGLFGQGREDVFLLTFNEDANDIDQAFLRPGRCIAHLGFPKFAPAEAAAWLEEKGLAEAAVEDDATLAELYERVHRGKSAELAAPAGGKGFGAGRRG